MQVQNPHALYVHCDGAMDYGPNSMAGVGIVVRFPESCGLEEMTFSIGRYSGANIERIEMEALTQAMNKTLELFREFFHELRNVQHIIFVTDRFGLADTEKRTNPFLIKQWRSNKWKNFEGKPIKNHEIIDKLDKARTKLRTETRRRIEIQYMPRKKNKTADKLAKKGKSEGLVNRKLALKAEKIGKRRYDGCQVPYKAFKVDDELHIHIYRKIGVQDQWEVWGELCSGIHSGKNLKIYVDDEQEPVLQRGNEFIVKLSRVCLYYFRIHDSVVKVEKEKETLTEI
jgi:ribonuclease HI